MFKFLTVGLILLSSLSVHAMDGLDIALGVSMKSIVRSKLWYEGIEKPNMNYHDTAQFAPEASEELIVALEKYEQI